METIEDIVKEYREKPVKGRFIDLVPFEMKWAEPLLKVRNSEKSRYFLNQSYCLTLDQQRAWYEAYLERTDDIYWCILNKEGRFLGTISLYDINPDRSILDHGRFIVDSDASKEAPYAVEALLLSLDAAFDAFQIGKVINDNRHDNKVMNNLSLKFGFKFIKDIEIRGVPYKHYLLSKEDYLKKRVDIDALIDYWAAR